MVERYEVMFRAKSADAPTQIRLTNIDASDIDAARRWAEGLAAETGFEVVKIELQPERQKADDRTA